MVKLAYMHDNDKNYTLMLEYLRGLYYFSPYNILILSYLTEISFYKN